VLNTTTPIKQIGFWRWALVGIASLLLGGLIYWRLAGPVLVVLQVNLDPTLPFEVQITPAMVWARPGEVISAVYTIRNNDIIPLEAFGRLNIEPASANDQIQIFVTQCSGLNAFQNSYPQDYNVVFRVQPAGLLGNSVIFLQHEFDRAVTR
jgi:hypothetical protein